MYDWLTMSYFWPFFFLPLCSRTSNIVVPITLVLYTEDICSSYSSDNAFKMKAYARLDEGMGRWLHRFMSGTEDCARAGLWRSLEFWVLGIRTMNLKRWLTGCEHVRARRSAEGLRTFFFFMMMRRRRRKEGSLPVLISYIMLAFFVSHCVSECRQLSWIPVIDSCALAHA